MDKQIEIYFSIYNNLYVSDHSKFIVHYSQEENRMTAYIPFKKNILFILVFFLSMSLVGCNTATRDDSSAARFLPPADEAVKPPGSNSPGGGSAISNDPLPTLVLPDTEYTIENSLPIKPVRFRNLGTVAYTVSAWSYKPLDSSYPFIASVASTVATPGGSNSSNSLSLPLGTYTWCYWWELGDTNGDGIMEYAHAIDNRPVLLDESDSDDLDFAETVDLAAPASSGVSYGQCGLDITPFIVDQKHVDAIIGPAVNMGHDTDAITLRGPITVAFWYVHAEQEIFPGVPRTYTKPETVVIPAGDTYTFELVDGREDHPGDWNMYIWLLSINK